MCTTQLYLFLYSVVWHNSNDEPDLLIMFKFIRELKIRITIASSAFLRKALHINSSKYYSRRRLLQHVDYLLVQ